MAHTRKSPPARKVFLDGLQCVGDNASNAGDAGDNAFADAGDADAECNKCGDIDADADDDGDDDSCTIFISVIPRGNKISRH